MSQLARPAVSGERIAGSPKNTVDYEMTCCCGTQNGESLEKRKIQARKWCSEYLGGSWRNVTLEEFHIEVLLGGLSNELFICSLPADYPITKKESRQVLLRIYGRLYGELVSDVHALVSDIVVFALLSERQVGPKLYAIFPEGRLEELLPARNLATDELRKPENSVKIARKVHQFHGLSLPLCKEPRWMWDTCDRILQDIDAMVAEQDKQVMRMQQMCQKFDIHKEYNFLRKFLTSKPSPVVFCHNDLQEGNVLAIPQGTDSEGKEKYNFQLIDFEYSAYNYRGFDFANHFCEWMYDYTLPEPPYFKMIRNGFPSKEEQLVFIRAYLGKDKNCHGSDKITIEEQSILDDVQRFNLASHFLWGSWAIVQAKLSTIQFGYLEYAVSRFECYEHQKKKLGFHE